MRTPVDSRVGIERRDDTRGEAIIHTSFDDTDLSSLCRHKSTASDAAAHAISTVGAHCNLTYSRARDANSCTAMSTRIRDW